MPKNKASSTKNDPPFELLRQFEGTPVSRDLELDLSSIDLERRTVEVAISSEYPVFREEISGIEVLDHEPSSINLSRMPRAPLLDNHNRNAQIGRVEACWLDPDRRLRARVRFSKNPAAELIWLDVIDDIKVNVSLSYLVHVFVPEYGPDGAERFRAISWEPYEVSIVSVPADPTVGKGRSLSSETYITTVRGDRMDPENTEAQEQTTLDAQRSLPATPRDPVANERRRVADIMTLGETHGQRALANDAIQRGLTVEQTAAAILASSNPRPLEPNQPHDKARDLPSFLGPGQKMEELGVKPQELQSYSMMRAIEAMASGNWKHAGFERSISLAIADASKKEARGLFVPHETIFQRQLEKKTPGKGGVLVDTDLRIDQFVDTLRNKAMVGRLGARVLSGLVGDLAIPRKTNGTNFYWLDEDDEPDMSDFDFSTLNLAPKTIAGAIAVTRKLRKQSSMSVENLMRQDMIEGIAVAIDAAQLKGTGQNNQPLGLLNQTGLPGFTYDTAVDWDDIVDMETMIANANADESGMAYLTSPTQRGIAKKTQVFANTGERLWGADNTVNGYRAFATNQMPADAWLHGDWSQIITALWGVLDLNVDKSTKAGTDGLVLRIFQDVDTQARRLESFSCLRKKVA